MTELRRYKIVDILKSSDKPVSASLLAKKFNVSRQIIVGDIALLRASNIDIIATNRGYILDKKLNFIRVFKVSHDKSRTRDELNIIVDGGGSILDVFVKHSVYGKITGQLNISSRREVDIFIEKSQGVKNLPLSSLTDMVHYHSVWAESEEVLDFIEEGLRKEGFLVE